MARRLRVAVLLALVATTAATLATPRPGDARDPRGGRTHPDRRAAKGCRDKNLVPTAANLERVRAATECLINERRRSKRLRPLRGNVELRRAAQDFSNLMVREQFFDHVGPDGSTLSSRVERTKYLGRARSWSLGENLDFDLGRNATPLLTVRRWMASPEHRIHILDDRYRDVGLGVTIGLPMPGEGDGDAGGATYSAVFGARRN